MWEKEEKKQEEGEAAAAGASMKEEAPNSPSTLLSLRGKAKQELHLLQNR